MQRDLNVRWFPSGRKEPNKIQSISFFMGKKHQFFSLASMCMSALCAGRNQAGYILCCSLAINGNAVCQAIPVKWGDAQYSDRHELRSSHHFVEQITNPNCSGGGACTALRSQPKLVFEAPCGIERVHED